MIKNARILFWMVVMVVIVAPAAHAWRDSIASQWPAKPVVIDGRGFEWPDWPVEEDQGVAFRAMNDASHLYLLIGGANDDGRVLLSGKYRQSLTLWFLKPDHQTKDWGILIDFGQARSPDTTGPLTLDVYGVTPQKLTQETTSISTTTLPAEIVIQTDLSTEYGRQPVYEISIPLQMLEIQKRLIFLDLTSSEFSANARVEIQAGLADIHPADKNPPPAKGTGDAPPPPAAPKPAEVPKPLHLQYTIKLEKQPK